MHNIHRWIRFYNTLVCMAIGSPIWQLYEFSFPRFLHKDFMTFIKLTISYVSYVEILMQQYLFYP